jgi:hypothetical protein
MQLPLGFFFIPLPRSKNVLLLLYAPCPLPTNFFPVSSQDRKDEVRYGIRGISMAWEETFAFALSLSVNQLLQVSTN